MAAMTTDDGLWRVEASGTGPRVVWYHLVGPDIEQWLPSTPALIAALEGRSVELADLREANPSNTAR
jgi:hypothetical protein